MFSLKKKKVVDRDKMDFGEMEDLVGEGLRSEEEDFKE